MSKYGLLKNSKMSEKRERTSDKLPKEKSQSEKNDENI